MCRSVVLLLLVSMMTLGLSGCMLDRSGQGVPGTDSGPGFDAARPDAGGGRSDAGDAGFDAGVDASLPGDDAGPLFDAGTDAGFDAGPGFDAGTDAGFDAGTDAGTDAGFDAGTDAGFDAGMDAGFDAGTDAGFDAGTDAGFDAGPPSCTSIYGGATGYVYCAETRTECEFFTVEDRVRTCTSTCAAFGGTCVRRWRDGASACEHRDRNARSCDTTNNQTDICVCTRP